MDNDLKLWGDGGSLDSSNPDDHQLSNSRVVGFKKAKIVMKKIWGNTLVKNEDHYLWFAIKSVIGHLDKILIWDTGSTDKTLEIIKLLQKEYPDKIDFQEIGKTDAKGLAQARQKMLEQTKADWLLLVDGDEVWWEDSIKKVVEMINNQGENLYALINPVYNLVGDIYHYQDPSAGQYHIKGKIGHFNIRAVNRQIPGLHIKGEYPLEGFYDEDEQLIQEKHQQLEFVDGPILHFSHLPRSTSTGFTLHRRKIKYELGMTFPKGFSYPEVLFLKPPPLVPSPWQKMSWPFKMRAIVETPLRKVKRRLTSCG